jgi:soluble lytic murein transglycosylase-like protein
MVSFPRKIIFAVAVFCVFSGLGRSAILLSNQSNSTGSLTYKQKKIAPLTVDGKADYAGCLANLNGLEKALIEAAIESKIDPKLLLAVMKVESGCATDSLSPRGAVGLMQILPSTASSLGKLNAHQPSENIRAGAKYLRELKNQFGPDLQLTLAAYNAGPTAVRKYKGIPPYKETRNYVAKVMKVYEGYKL